MMDLTDPTRILQQWTELQDKSFKNALNTMEMFQKRAEKMAGQFWEQTIWASGKMSDTLMDWGNVYRTGYENLQRVIAPAFPVPSKPTPTGSASADADSSQP